MKKVEILYLSHADVKKVGLKMKDIISIVEQALYEHGSKSVEMPPKPGVHPLKNTFIHAMPAYIPKMNAVGMKWVACFPENYKHNLEQTTGLIILNDPQTGVPVAVMDCAWVTAMRTAAVSAIAVKYLARTNSRIVGIVGAGVQGRYNLLSLREALAEIDLVKVYDIRREVLKKYVEEASANARFEIVPVKSAREAVEDSDIVVTATTITSKPEPFIKDEWLKKGALGLPLEFDCAWEAKALKTCDKFVTDDAEQTRSFTHLGYFPEGVPDIYAELGEIVAGKKKGRETNEERIIDLNGGIAIEDVSVGKKVYDLAQDKGIGIKLELMT
jgi:ornithine cyclodeaminase/alanine dehydrogenase